MKITAIKQQVKSDNRVSVFVDGKYSFSLTLDQLLREKLKKGLDLVSEDIERLKKLSDEGKLKQRALEWLLLRPHSVREFKDYMYRKKADKDLTESWVEDFKTKKYLNDEVFARWFSDQRIRKNKSMRAIISELRAKGVEQSIAEKVVANLDSGNEEALVNLVNKLRTRSRYKDEIKLKQYLVSKGFSYSEVKEALLRIESGDD